MKKLSLVLGLAALLSVGVLTGGAKEVTSASAATTGDVELDVGVNFTTVDQSQAGWPESLHWISPNDGNCSEGDSFALRIRNNTPVDIWFTFCPNLGGTLVKPNYTEYTETTWVNGVKGTTTGRGWYLESRLPANFDGWLFLPKTAFTIDKNTGGTITPDWTVGAWSYYVIFYGSTDYVNVDLGTVATGNLATGQIIRRLIDWNVRTGTDGVTDDFNGAMLTQTRLNENLVPVAKFYRNIANVDACNQAACQAAVSANTELFGTIRNNATLRLYFNTLKVTDYDDGDVLHEGGKSVTYTLSEKWTQIQMTAAGTSAGTALYFVEEKNYVSTIVLVSTVIALATGLFFIVRRRAHN